MNGAAPYIPGDPPERRRVCRRSESVRAALQRLIKTVSSTIAVAEEAVQDLQALMDGLDDGQQLPLLDNPACPGTRASRDRAERVLPVLAKLGVFVTITRDADGPATAILEQGQRLRVGEPEVADLLDVLCEDSGPREGAIVGWKSVSYIASRLRALTGRDVSPGAIRTAKWRLKLAMMDQNLNWHLLQTDRFGRYRFARKVKE